MALKVCSRRKEERHPVVCKGDLTDAKLSAGSFMPNQEEILPKQKGRSDLMSAPPVVRKDIFHHIRCGIKTDQCMIEAE